MHLYVFIHWLELIYTLVGSLVPANHRSTFVSQTPLPKINITVWHFSHPLSTGRLLRSHTHDQTNITDILQSDIVLKVSLTLLSIHQAGVLFALFACGRGTFIICSPRLCKRDGCSFDQTVPAFEVVHFRIVKVSTKTWKRFFLIIYTEFSRIIWCSKQVRRTS